MNFKKLFIKIKNIIKSKKGLSSIELVIGALASIVIFAGYLDFIIISNRMQAMSTSMTYLTRTISNQGCLSNNPETTCLINGKSGYVKDYIKNKKFVTSSEMYKQLEKIMKNENIPDRDWAVYVNGEALTANTTTQLFDFGEKIEIDIEIQYAWRNVSNLLPLDIPNGQLKSNQNTLSLYKFRTQGTDGGFDYGS